MTSPEFSRLVPLARIGGAPFRQEIAATPAECAALAARFGLLTLDRLTAEVSLRRRTDETILLQATFEAAFTQECVVSLDPVAATAAESFALCYGSPEAEPASDDNPDAPAFEPLSGDAIDIGEAVAQEFSLSLPAFPRDPEAIVEIEPEPADDGPFAALSRLAKPSDHG
jgi:uncharacterized metal-binding protein YceD (DUF177 family)